MNPTAELFAMAGIWCLISAVACRYITPSWPGRIGLFAVLVGIPFWELPYGYYNYRKLCDEAVGPFVSEKIDAQESICVDDLYDDVALRIRKIGFKIVEFSGGVNFRPIQEATFAVVKVKKGEGKSVYCYSSRAGMRLPWRIWRHDDLIVRAAGSNVVARLSGYQWGGMWWQEDMRPIFGYGGRCGAPFEQVLRIVRVGGEVSLDAK